MPFDPEKKIVVCGAGMLGSWFTRFFAQAESGRIMNAPVIVIDMDNFEGRNRPTQFTAKHQMGVNKAFAVSESLSQFEIPYQAIDSEMNVDMIYELLKTPTALVVDAFDNHPSRCLTKLYAKVAGCECLHLAVSPVGFGLVEWSKDWSLDPERLMSPVIKEEVKLAPCELVAYFPLGVQVAMRGSQEAINYLLDGKTDSYNVNETSHDRFK